MPPFFYEQNQSAADTEEVLGGTRVDAPHGITAIETSPEEQSAASETLYG